MKRKWLVRGILLLLGLVVLTVVGGLLFLRSSPGRDLIKAQAVEAVRPLFRGGMEVGAIEGDLTSRLIVRDLVIRDAESRPAVRVDYAEAVYDLGDLIDLQVQRVTVRGVDVQAHTTTTGLNLAELTVPSESSSESPPPSVTVEQIVLEDLSFSLDDETYANDLDLRTSLGLQENRLALPDLTVEVDGATLTTERARLHLEHLATEVTAEVDVPAKLLKRFDPAIGADVSLDLRVDHPRGGEWKARLEGVVGGAKTTGRVKASDAFGQVELGLEVERFDPNRIHRAAPVGDLNLRLMGRVEGARVHAQLVGRGELKPPGLPTVGLTDVTATATISEGRLIAGLRVDAGPDRVRAEASAQLGVTPVLEALTATARLSRLQPYLPPDAGTDASVTVDLKGEGPIDDLTLQGRAEVRRLTAPSVKLGRADLRFDAGGLPQKVVGTLDLEAGGLHAGGLHFDTVSAEVRPQGDAFLVAVRAKDGAPIASADLDGTVTLALPQVRTELQLRLPAGEVRLTAEVDTRDPLRRPGQIALATGPIRLDALPVAGLAGVARLTLRGPIAPPDLVLDADLEAVRFRQSAPADGSLQARWARSITASVSVAVADLLSASAALEADAPADPIALGPGDLTRMELALSNVQLGTLAEELVKQSLPRIPMSGAAQAQVSVDRRAISIDARVDGYAPSPQLTIDAVLKGRGRNGALELALVATSTAGDAEVQAEIEVPRRPFDLQHWSHLGPGSVRRLKAEIPPIDVSPFLPVSGRVEASLVAEDGLAAVDGKVTATDVRTGAVDVALDGEVHVRATARQTTAVGKVEGKGRRLVDLNAATALGIKGILEGKDIARSALQGAVVLRDAPMSLLGELIKRPEAFAGALAGTATITGTLQRPRVKANFSAKKPRIGPMDFETFEVGGRFTGRSLSARANLRQVTGGFIELNLGSAPELLELQIEAQRFRLDFVNFLLPRDTTVGLGGTLFGSLSIEGKENAFQSDGTLRLEAGTLVPPRPLDVLRNIEVEVAAKGRDIRLQGKGTSGEGTLAFDAEAAWDGATSATLSGSARTEDLPLAIGKTAIALDLVAALKGAISPQDSHVDVELTEGLVEIPEKAAQDVREIAQMDDVVFVDEEGRREGSERKAAAAPAADFTVKIATADPLPVRSKEVNATARIDLEAKGRRVVGRVSVGNGTIQIGGRPWRIERAHLDFDGSIPPRPVLDVELVAELEALTVMIFVTGTPEDPVLRFESRPATYDQAQLLAIVLGGEPGGSDETFEESAANAATGAAVGYLVGVMRERFGQDIGLDTIAIDVDDQATAATLRLGKWITSKLFIGYEHKIGAEKDENVAEAVIRYRFLPDWMVESRFGNRGRGGVDLLWSKRF